MKKPVTVLCLTMIFCLFPPALAQISAVENSVNVQIQDFKIEAGPGNKVAKDQTLNITCTLKNLSDFDGMAGAGVSIPSAISYSVSTAGGSSYIHFFSGESQPFKWTLTNRGNLAEDSGTIELTLTVSNHAGTTTDQQIFEVNVLAGLNNPTDTPYLESTITQAASPEPPISAIDWILVAAVSACTTIAIGGILLYVKRSQKING